MSEQGWVFHFVLRTVMQEIGQKLAGVWRKWSETGCFLDTHARNRAKTCRCVGKWYSDAWNLPDLASAGSKEVMIIKKEIDCDSQSLLFMVCGEDYSSPTTSTLMLALISL